MYRKKSPEQLVATFDRMIQHEQIKAAQPGEFLLPDLPCPDPTTTSAPRTLQVTRVKAEPSPIRLQLLEMCFMEGSSTTPWDELRSLEVVKK